MMIAFAQQSKITPIDQVIHGDCLSVLATLEDNSIDAMVTDPPSSIHFMGKEWDSDKGGRAQWIAWLAEIMIEAKRCLKPGGHALIWALPRTSHWTATALEDAGFEIRDVITHLFGSGFPKSLSLDKAIDKHLKAEREVVGRSHRHPGGMSNKFAQDEWTRNNAATMGQYITAPATPQAAQYAGFGTSLKPASEHWILCRKPLSEKSIAENVLKWGTAGLNIDASRVEGPTWQRSTPWRDDIRGNSYHAGLAKKLPCGPREGHPQGRWPSNLILSHSLWCVAKGVKRVQANGPSPLPRVRDTDSQHLIGLAYDSPLSYRDEDGLEEVQDWQCWQGGTVTVPCYEYKSCVLTPLSEPSFLLDQLACVLEDLPQYSKTCNNPLPHAYAVFGSEHTRLEDRDVSLLSELAHALGLSRVVGSLFDCPSCLRSGGEYAHRIVTASQDGLPSLHDALSDVYHQQMSLVYNQHYQGSVFPHEGADRTRRKPQSRTVLDVGHDTKTSHVPQFHIQGTLFEALPLVEPHDSSQMNNTAEDDRHERRVHNDCKADLVRLLAFLAFDILSHVLPIDIIQQKSIDINTSPCPIAELDQQSGQRKSGAISGEYGYKQYNTGVYGANRPGSKIPREASEGGASRYFSQFSPDADDFVPFKYVSKASRAERNNGLLLDSTEIVVIELSQYCETGGNQWENQDLRVRLQVDTGQSPPRVIDVSGIPNSSVSEWNTFLFGNDTTAPFLKECTFTIATMTSSITASRTLSWLIHSLTSGSIADVKSEMVNGGSHAASVKTGIPSVTIMCDQTVSLPGVGPVTAQTPFTISASVKPANIDFGTMKAGGSGKPVNGTGLPLPRANGHPCVKPLALMRWLCRLITPPDGIVLDPFVGSGSTAVAAIQEGFHFIGIEQSEEYCAIAEARIAHAMKWEGVL